MTTRDSYSRCGGPKDNYRITMNKMCAHLMAFLCNCASSSAIP